MLGLLKLIELRRRISTVIVEKTFNSIKKWINEMLMQFVCTFQKYLIDISLKSTAKTLQNTGIVYSTIP